MRQRERMRRRMALSGARVRAAQAAAQAARAVQTARAGARAQRCGGGAARSVPAEPRSCCRPPHRHPLHAGRLDGRLRGACTRGWGRLAAVRRRGVHHLARSAALHAARAWQRLHRPVRSQCHRVLDTTLLTMFEETAAARARWRSRKLATRSTRDKFKTRVPGFACGLRRLAGPLPNPMRPVITGAGTEARRDCRDKFVFCCNERAFLAGQVEPFTGSLWCLCHSRVQPVVPSRRSAGPPPRVPLRAHQQRIARRRPLLV